MDSLYRLSLEFLEGCLPEILETRFRLQISAGVVKFGCSSIGSVGESCPPPFPAVASFCTSVLKRSRFPAWIMTCLQESLRCLCIACALLPGSCWIITFLLVAIDFPASGVHCCIPECFDCRDVLKQGNQCLMLNWFCLVSWFGVSFDWISCWRIPQILRELCMFGSANIHKCFLSSHWSDEISSEWGRRQ